MRLAAVARRSTVAELIADEGRVARMRAAELAHLKGRDLGDDLALLAAAEPLPLPPEHGMRLAVRGLIAGAVAATLHRQGPTAVAQTDPPARHGLRRAA